MSTRVEGQKNVFEKAAHAVGEVGRYAKESPAATAIVVGAMASLSLLSAEMYKLFTAPDPPAFGPNGILSANAPRMVDTIYVRPSTINTQEEPGVYVTRDQFYNQVSVRIVSSEFSTQIRNEDPVAVVENSRGVQMTGLPDQNFKGHRVTVDFPRDSFRGPADGRTIASFSIPASQEEARQFLAEGGRVALLTRGRVSEGLGRFSPVLERPIADYRLSPAVSK